jgi:hypothetical protein
MLCLHLLAATPCGNRRFRSDPIHYLSKKLSLLSAAELTAVGTWRIAPPDESALRPSLKRESVIEGLGKAESESAEIEFRNGI